MMKLRVIFNNLSNVLIFHQKPDTTLVFRKVIIASATITVISVRRHKGFTDISINMLKSCDPTLHIENALL